MFLGASATHSSEKVLPFKNAQVILNMEGIKISQRLKRPELLPRLKGGSGGFGVGNLFPAPPPDKKIAHRILSPF